MKLANRRIRLRSRRLRVSPSRRCSCARPGFRESRQATTSASRQASTASRSSIPVGAERSSIERAFSSRSGARRRRSTRTRARFATPKRLRQSLRAPSSSIRRRSSSSSPTGRAASCTSPARPTPERAKILKEAGIVGLSFVSEEQRFYPLNHVASQVVGYAGTDNHGLAGLELGLEVAALGQAGQARR